VEADCEWAVRMRERGLGCLELTAADELDDFVTVAGLDGGLRPLRARKNFEIALDGDAADRKVELLEKIDYGATLGGFALFAVDGDGDHYFYFTTREARWRTLKERR
jgi:hypothetical protein